MIIRDPENTAALSQPTGSFIYWLYESNLMFSRSLREQEMWRY